ncbi:MAG: PQQ-binding-like beta-propeller repeat protein [Verrucomicrobiota bacterium]
MPATSADQPVKFANLLWQAWQPDQPRLTRSTLNCIRTAGMTGNILEVRTPGEVNLEGAQTEIPVVAGKKYVLSLKLKGAGVLLVTTAQPGDSGQSVKIKLSTAWQTVTLPVTAKTEKIIFGVITLSDHITRWPAVLFNKPQKCVFYIADPTCHCVRSGQNDQPDVGGLIRMPKKNFPETDLSQVKIVVPADGRYDQLAQVLKQHIAAKCHAAPSIVTDRDFSGRYTSKRPLILLGDINANRAVYALYCDRYTPADSLYPGDGGYLVHTIHDPFATGINVIVLAGDVQLACDVFIKKISRIVRPPNIGPLFELKLGAGGNTIPGINNTPAITQEVQRVSDHARKGGHTGPWRDIAAFGQLYALTGKDVYAEIFKRLVFFAQQHADSGHGNWGSPWGFDADFPLLDVIPAWDAVEESPVLSDDDRLEITRILVRYIRHCPAHIEDLTDFELRVNHSTFAATGLYIAGLYFKKYYRLPEAERWIAIGEKCIAPHLRAINGNEDANGYLWLPFKHALAYTLASGDTTFFDSNAAGKIADYANIITDNLGREASFGDNTASKTRGGQSHRMAASFHYRDGRHLFFPATQGMPYAFNSNLLPVEPSHLAGVSVYPLEPLFYLYATGTPLPKNASCFDKLSFRDGFNRMDQYLLLDGINEGNHKHFDGNSILRLTRNGKTWLSDSGYFNRDQQCHNTVCIYRDGQAASLPPFAGLEHARAFKRAAFSQSIMSGYNKSNWRRNIFSLRNQYFVLADDIEALADEKEAVIRVFFQTLGAAKLSETALTLTQDDQQFTIQFPAGPATQLKTGKLSNGANVLEGYDEDTHTFIQTSEVALEKNRSFVQWNLMAGHGIGQRPPGLQRLSQNCIRIACGGEIIFTGIGSGKSPENIPDGPSVQAAMFQISAEYFALIAGTQIRWPDPVFAADGPVDIEFDFQANAGTIVAGKPTQITLAVPEDTALRINRRSVNYRRSGATATFSVPAGGHTVEFVPQAVLRREAALQKPVKTVQVAVPYIRAFQPTTTALKKIWAHSEDGALGAMAIADINNDGGAEIIVGGESQSAYALTGGGKKLWQLDTGGTVRCIWAGCLGQGSARIAVGSHDAKLYVADGAGRIQWTWQAHYHNKHPSISCVTAGDMLNNGKPVFVVGSDNWFIYALSSDGKELWRFLGCHEVRAVALADFDGHGRPDIIFTTGTSGVFCVTPLGRRKWAYSAKSSNLKCLTSGHLDGGAAAIPVTGGRDNYIQAIDRYMVNHAGFTDALARWEWNTGDEVTAIVCCDLDGNGKDDVLACSRNRNVYAINGDTGEKHWRTRLQAIPFKLAAGNFINQDNIDIAVGTDTGIMLLAGRNGKPLAHYKTKTPVTAIAGYPTPAGPDRIIAATQGGEVIMLAGGI